MSRIRSERGGRKKKKTLESFGKQRADRVSKNLKQRTAIDEDSKTDEQMDHKLLVLDGQQGEKLPFVNIDLGFGE